MNCPSPQHLLEYAEGAASPSITAHVAECAACREQLTELGAFETLLAGSDELPAAERARLRTVTERALQGERPHSGGSVHRFPFWTSVGLATLAAALLAALTLWPAAHGLTDLDVRCYPPEGTTRAERIERFALSLRTADPRWIAIWAIGPNRGKRLLPDANAPLPNYGMTFPLSAGDHRMPATELLDFEYSPAAAPRQLVVIATADELRADQLAAVDALVGQPGGREAFWPTLSSQYPEARLLDFPAR